ncbi:acyltransferase family protein [Hamadaea sp. NPDC051192]|uniref:acyltransferase family protein n=1 Tax=Hamadaea sp. NPDC051192 TaxID=3154940 RepID=UPI00343F5BE5
MSEAPSASPQPAPVNPWPVTHVFDVRVEPGLVAEPQSPTKHRERFRADVEGMRAIAVLLVMLFHSGLVVFRGGFVGVDVFFVISGFLITTQLGTELFETKTISLARFYARRAKRLLPAAFVVLATTLLGVWWAFPRTRWAEVGGDIVGSALYVVNWRLADRSVDYLAQDIAPSPVQHYWSLAVEEQFYLLWPLLLLIATLIARLLSRPRAMMLRVGVAVIAIPSFLWSVVESFVDPARGFFITTTRMWELGLGAFVALIGVSWRKLPRVTAAAMGWGGLAAILVSGIAFTQGVAWPGFLALLPTAGAGAVIAAGFALRDKGPAALLSMAPLRWIGKLSYSLYLWHWPLLIIAEQLEGDLSVAARLGIVAFSFIPAWLTYRLVENPLRYASALTGSSRFALSVGANFTLAAVAGGLALSLTAGSSSVPIIPTPQASQALKLGAAVLRDDPRNDPAGAPVDTVAWMTPAPVQANDDIPQEYADKCQQGNASAKVLTCEAGDPKGTVSVAVVGDSKMTQWMPALRRLALQNHWRLTTYLKNSCSFALAVPDYDGKAYQSCRTWTGSVVDRLTEQPPDYLITSQGQSRAYDDSDELTSAAMVDGLRQVWSTLTGHDVKVIVIADNPGPTEEAPDCADRNARHLTACAFDRGRYETASAAPVLRQAVEGQKQVTMVDLFDAICPTDRCSIVIGSVLVYRQGSHLTKTYVETLLPRLAKALTKANLKTVYLG